METKVYVSIIKVVPFSVEEGDEIVAIGTDLEKVIENTKSGLLEHCAFYQPSLRLPNFSLSVDNDYDGFDEDIWVVTLKDLDNEQLYTANIYLKEI